MSEDSRMSLSAPDEVHADQPNSARMYDYLLGGSANFVVDRQAVEQMLDVFPDAAYYARCNRAFLARAVRHLCTLGIDQFLDLGSGVPTVGNVHEIAHQHNRQARIAYVDHEPVAVAHARHLLGEHEYRATVTEADLRDPESVLNARSVGRFLDLSRPVGLLAVGVLPFVPDPDAAAVLAHYRDRIAPGSHVAVSHLAQLGMSDEQLAEGLEIMRRTPTPEQPRDTEELRGLLGDFTVVDPGIVPVALWHPESAPSEQEAQRSNCLGAVARRE